MYLFPKNHCFIGYFVNALYLTLYKLMGFPAYKYPLLHLFLYYINNFFINCLTIPKFRKYSPFFGIKVRKK